MMVTHKMVTHKIIKDEAAQLKELMDEQLEIPSFFSCVKPALLLEAWMVLCPLISFFLANQSDSELLSATGMSAFLGLLISVSIVNGRSLYLSLPVQFREHSQVLVLLSKKIKNYAMVFLSLVLILSVLASNSALGSIAYIIPLTFFTVVMAFIFNMDIGRYRLSAFTSVLELLKSRKQGGE
ncbi:hypothetical protein JEM67_00140 (plasmid) [Serratia sp. PAMC26656]|uniref:hypothetical protein n=1 Tax=Serratia sp. PAMC26656 TaxID=2775909 RepID=UPI0018F72B8C|nr:hypothetical protein [Serratia sp. PAMC26656]MBJ7889508.1 hypothetical protein [Serratia sp. PAMC26656]